MDNKFEANIKGFGFKEPPKKEVETWAKDSDKILKENDIPFRVVGRSGLLFYKIMTIAFFIALFVSIGLFIYYFQEGKFQSNISQSVQPQVNVTSNSPVSVQNTYSQPILNNITINLPSDMLNLCRQALNCSNSIA